jgi:hypothetical protein
MSDAAPELDAGIATMAGLTWLGLARLEQGDAIGA